MHDAYLSHMKVQITASRKDISLVLVYGITEHLMILATNKEIKSKDDVIKIAKVAFLNKEAARSMAEKIILLMEVKSFSLEEWISEKMLTGWLLCVSTLLLSHDIFFINIFCCSTFRTITNPPKGFKFISIGFHHITVIDMDNRMTAT